MVNYQLLIVNTRYAGGVKVQKELTLKRAMNRKKVVPLHGRKTRYREPYS